ncbi:dynein assembly factor 5, axonemal [Trichonephila inaurata madagascariensis]|uniref:Dynein assembly factor 5, axonemal n=1 Tax=Trichonephila inaurata madagascariensis TaxID=2747483 RepID=A0A8X7C9M6_9ARAC|nr:dynein assembly factor 5, axonemal [Trichonephila inaurata madagascariensis]
MMLFQQNAIPFLKMLSDNNEFWTSPSPEMPILQFVVESGCLEEETMELIIPVLINNLHHSRTASSLRTIDVASFYEVLNKSPIKKEILTSVGDELIPLIATLFDAEQASTRLMTCKNIGNYSA